MQQARRILVLYLRTGGGHTSTSHALEREFARRAGVTAVSADGMPRRRALRGLIEDGYRFSASVHPVLWKGIYESSRPRLVLNAMTWLMAVLSWRHVAELIDREGADTVISTHFLLIRPIQRAIAATSRRAGAHPVRAVTVVTDPFTAHPIWFYRNRTSTVVFSEELRRWVLRNTEVEPRKLVVTNPIFTPPAVFADDAPSDRSPRACARVLFAGGGDGLPGADRHVGAILARRLPVEIDVVCGHNDRLSRQVERVVESAQIATQEEGPVVRVHGFVDYLPQLLSKADIVVAKAGPAGIYETLAAGKAPVIAAYYYGQEWGNVRYVGRERVGRLVTDPERMAELVEELVLRPELRESMERRVRALGVRNGVDEVVDYVLGLTPAAGATTEGTRGEPRRG